MLKNKTKIFFMFILILQIVNFAYSENSSQKNWEQTELSFYDELSIWKKSYPDVKFVASFDKKNKDYKIVVTHYGQSKTFYYANGLYLPEAELVNKEKYWRVITSYKNEPLNPANFTEEQKSKISEFGSSKNRRNGRVSSKAIFDAIYDSATRRSTEQHIIQIKFLGKYSNIHEYLKAPLARVEKQILEISSTNQKVKKFLEELYSAEAYNWREIRDSNTKSFHSFGIAIDILPKMWGNKIVYWGFEKQKGNAEWMMIPLEKRWAPPKEVIDIFLREGFIWGGNWAIWDNMHFEYHPELVAAMNQEIAFLQKNSDLKFLDLKTENFLDLNSSNVNFSKAEFFKFSFIKKTKLSSLNTTILRDYIFEFFIIGFLFIVALYNLILFCFNSTQKMYIFLMLLCLDFILLVASVDSDLLGLFGLISTRFPSPDFLINKIILVSAALLILFYSLSACCFFDIKFGFNIVVFALEFLVSVLLIFIPVKYFDILIFLTICWIILGAIYLLILVIKKVNLKEKIYFAYTISFVVFLLIAVYLIFIDPHRDISFKIGFILFTLVQSILTSVKRDMRFEFVANQVNELENEKNSKKRFVSQSTINFLQVVDSKDNISGKKSVCEGMIFVCSIRNFPEIQKRLSAEKAFEILAKYFQIVTICVKSCGGIITQSLSTEIVTIFPEKNDSVCKKAFEIQKRLRQEKNIFSKIAGFEIELKVDMSIHLGSIALGFMGNENYVSSVSCSKQILQAQELVRRATELDSSILITDDALVYCRSFTGCLFSGIKIKAKNFFAKECFIYKMIPYEKF